MGQIAIFSSYQKNANTGFSFFVADKFIAYGVRSDLGQSVINMKFMNSALTTEGLLFNRRRILAVFGHIKAMNRNALLGFFMEIILFGINNNFKRLKLRDYVSPYRNFKRTLDVELHMAKKLRLKLPEDFHIRAFKRRLMVFSFSRERVIAFYRYLQRFRKANPYTGKGIRVRHRKVRYKIGKKRIR
jgi:ribosomal protein L6P/L9E